MLYQYSPWVGRRFLWVITAIAALQLTGCAPTDEDMAQAARQAATQTAAQTTPSRTTRERPQSWSRRTSESLGGVSRRAPARTGTAMRMANSSSSRKDVRAHRNVESRFTN